MDVKAETSGRLQTSSSHKGQQVKAGQVICELAENGRRAQLSQAQAAYDKARIDFDGATTLKKKALLSDTQLAANKEQHLVIQSRFGTGNAGSGTPVYYGAF